MRSVALAILALVLFVAASAGAATIEARGAWIRATPPGAPTAAAYVTLVNHGLATDRLMGGATRVAAEVTPHHMSTTGGIMRMRPITGGLAIGARASATLGPSGDHLMLIGLKQTLKAGQHVRIVLHFQRAGNVAVDFPVLDAPPGGMHM